MQTILIGIIGLAALALIVVAVTFRRGDTSRAIGQLSNETLRKDRASLSTLAETDAGVAGGSKELERSAAGGSPGSVVVADAKPPAVWIPPDPETLGVTRRQFLNRSIVGMFAFSLTGFGLACLAFLWPPPGGGFGSKVNVGRLPDIEAAIRSGGGFFYVPEGRMWITEYPNAALAKAQTSYLFYNQVSAGLESGVVALFQTCPHLGCRVPECKTSQWFECPCHGSQYNRVGEKKGGPAPRGMDRFPMEINAAGELVVDTGAVIQGPPIGTNTTGQEAEGPNCLSDGGGHG